MAKQILGRVAMMNRGEWDSGQTYDMLDIVAHNGSSYTPNRDGVSSEPPSGDWTIIAAKGDEGSPATISIGDVTTGEPNTDAEVVNVGSSSNVVLNFTIPRGESGSDVSETVDKIVDDFYNESYYYDKNVETIPGYKVIDGYKLTVAGDTTFTIQPDSGNKVMGFPVKEGQTLQLLASAFYNATPAFVWATTTDTPQAWDGSNGLEMLSKNDNDYYLGSTELAWIVKTFEITVPSGAKMIWVFNRESKASIGVKKPSLEIKPINLYARETVFSIQKPEVTAGKVVEQKRYSRYNRPAWMWNFNTKAKISMKNVNVHASDSDKVGLWIYFSQSALTPANSTDGACELLVDGIKIGGTIYNAYRFTAGWNYLEIPINDGGDHTVEINFNRVRGDYTIALDTFEVNYIPKVKPQILLSFDEAIDILTDNRWTLVNKYGFVATFANPDELASNQEGLYEALSRGWDWALYGGIDSTVSRPDYDNGSVDDWERYLQTRIEKCEEVGLFEPFTYFSPKNRGSSAIEQALRNLGFKMARISGANTDNITWFDDYNMLYMQTVNVNGSATSSKVLQKIDDAIGKNSSIVVFTHKVEDNLSDDRHTTVDVYDKILGGIKQRVDAGLCEVSNFTDFFRKWCPESCAQKMRIREIKEHNYIMKHNI